VTPLQQL
jgi:hypothetical protein